MVTLPRLDSATAKSAWVGALDQCGILIKVDSVERGALPNWIAQRLAFQNQRVLAGEAGQRSLAFFADRGFGLGIDEPYAGSIVPMKHYQKDAKVKSIMLEINRTLYLDTSYGRGPRFNEIQGIVADFLSMIRGIR